MYKEKRDYQYSNQQENPLILLVLRVFLFLVCLENPLTTVYWF